MNPIQIQHLLDHPDQLEDLYRTQPAAFRKALASLDPDSLSHPVVLTWKARLEYGQRDATWGTRREWIAVLMLSLIAGLLAKLPDFLPLDAERYYPRNLSFIAMAMLSVYFAWKHTLPLLHWMGLAAVLGLSAVYINLLPGGDDSDTLILACLHMPLILWALLGWSFTAREWHIAGRRLEFMRYHGDLAVMGAVLMIAGSILSGVTVGLFGLIEMPIEDIYFRHIAIWGLAALPLVATQLVQANPGLVRQVSPVIARVFTPLVLVLVLVYLGSILITCRDPYNDREFLLLFNVLLAGVMALILFSVSGHTASRWSRAILFALSLLTLVVNGIALSAIVWRISSWGFTPNRIAVLGINVLMLAHLVLVAYRLFVSLRQKKSEDDAIAKTLTVYLPVYVLWAVLVTFVLPVVFGFR
jgi:hypothetical protein